MDALSISASGIRDAQLRLDAAAQNIATADTPAPARVNEVVSSSQTSGGVSSYIQSRETLTGVDLVSEFVNFKLAEHGVRANVEAAKVAGDIMGTLIDMVDTDDY